MEAEYSYREMSNRLDELIYEEHNSIECAYGILSDEFGVSNFQRFLIEINNN